MLKRVSLDDNPSELRIARLLSAPSRVAQEENHCVPLLDEFVVAESALGFVVDDVTIVSDTPHVMLVTPLLVPWTDYPFFNVGEVLEFFRQVFEGVQHMHGLRFAHRDIKVDNILMDGKLFSEPWHPMQTSWRRNLDKRVKMYTRTERPPRYFLADFGNAGYFPVNPSAPLKEPTLVEAVWGGQRAVPEFKSMAQGGDPVLHDPFATDIFYLGCLIVIFTPTSYTNFGFLYPLLSRMVHPNPEQRPDINEVVDHFDAIWRSLSSSKLSSHLHSPKESLSVRINANIDHYFRRLRYYLKKIPSHPLPRR